MRTVIIDPINSLALTQLLPNLPRSQLEQLQQFNPHVDLQKVAPGTVVLVPDAPAFSGIAGTSVAGDPFGELRAQILASVDAVVSRVSASYRALLAEEATTQAALNLPIVKRASATDSEVARQLELATQTFEQDRQRAATADTTLRSLGAQIGAELEALAQVLG